MNRYYVYAYVVDGIVRYVGKGSTGRLHQHMQIVRRIARYRSEGRKIKAEYFHNKLCKEWLNGAVVEPRVIADGLTEDEAYERERIEIAGAIPGTLWNQKSGGSDGVTYGDEFKRKQSEAAKRRYQDPVQREQARAIAHEFNSRPDVRAKHSETQKRRFAGGDPKAWRFIAAAHTPEVYRKRGETLKKTYAARPELVADRAAKSSEWWSDPANNSAQRNKLSAAHARPDVKAKRRAYYDSPEGRANLKRAVETRWAKARAEKVPA